MRDAVPSQGCLQFPRRTTLSAKAGHKASHYGQQTMDSQRALDRNDSDNACLRIQVVMTLWLGVLLKRQSRTGIMDCEQLLLAELLFWQIRISRMQRCSMCSSCASAASDFCNGTSPCRLGHLEENHIYILCNLRAGPCKRLWHCLKP